jgi:membrane associated rhomboid family serine protease
MGIYDRPYYRDETSGSGWLSGMAPACKAIILINVGVFLAQWILDDQRLEEMLRLSSTAVFKHFQIWRLATAPFLHDRAGIFGLVFEMWFFWFVGHEMESMYGTSEFVRMYLTAAVFSSFCWALVNYYGPSHGHGSMVGASGAVTAVVVLFTLHFPSREILLFFLLPVQMWLLMVIFLGVNCLSLMSELRGGDGPMMTAFAAQQLGGALYGYAYKAGDLRWSRLVVPRRRRPRLRVVAPDARDKVAPLTAGPARTVAGAASSRGSGGAYFPEEQLDAKLDEVLAKIAREGRSALTDEEKRVLEEASRRARSRRSDRD